MCIEKSFNIIVAMAHNGVQIFKNIIYNNKSKNWRSSVYTGKLWFLCLKNTNYTNHHVAKITVKITLCQI